MATTLASPHQSILGDQVNETRGIAASVRRLLELSGQELAVISIYLIATGLFRASQNAAQTTMPLIGHDLLGIGVTKIGLLATIWGGASVVTNLTIASLKRAHRSIFIVGLGAFPFGILAVVLSRTYFELIAAVLLLAISGGIVMPALASSSASLGSVSSKRGAVAFTVALSLSLAIGPLIEAGALHLSHDSLRMALAAFIPLAAIGSVLGISKLGRVDPQSVEKSSKGTTAYVLFRERGFRDAVFSLALYQFPFVAIISFAAILARSRFGSSAAFSQEALTLFFLVSFLSRAFLLLHPTKDKDIEWLRASAIFTIVGIVIIGIASSSIWYVVAMILLGVPHGLTYPLALNLLNETAEPQQLAKGNSILSATTGMISLAGPFVIGLLSARFGISTMFLLMVVPTLLFSAPLFVRRNIGSLL